MTQDQFPGWYAAFAAKDARFDGRFFVGVSSTGIYCRPVCPARLPKPENCAPFATAAAAEQAGFRPCLVCRPELAPHLTPVRASGALAPRAARLLATECSTGASLADLAGRLGYTERHLRRAFAQEYGVSPVQYLQTCRLLLAKSLLTDTALPVIDVAMASGFGSLRRFNDLFATRYRLTPSALRRQSARDAPTGEAPAPGDLTLTLGYRPPYRWTELLGFLADRTIPGVEVVADDAYARTVRLPAPSGGDAVGWVRVSHRPERRAVAVTLSSGLLPVLPQVLARVGDLFDLACDPGVVDAALSTLDAVRPGARHPGTRLPGCFDPFEMAVRAVLGQQVTVRAARTLAGRVAQAHGVRIDTEVEGLTHTFPDAATFAELGDTIPDHLGSLGVTRTRSHAVGHLAQAIRDGELDLDPSADPDAVVAALRQIPGIGPWTAGYLAMRALRWPDAFLPTDHGVKTALAPRTPAQIEALAEAWRPWRAYATVALWHSLAADPNGPTP